MDPAALFLAIPTVSVGFIVTEGAWEPLDGLLGLIVAVVLWSFTWPRGNEVRFTRREALPHALAYGLIAVTVFSWPLQIWVLSDGSPRCNHIVPSMDKGCVRYAN
ncbi:hypothetical protein C5C71_02180 [Rathayibacter sp. AY1C1]|nr:hypothetical protein C5C71_02180 [Rathayibacter sp. AY1C1]